MRAVIETIHSIREVVARSARLVWTSSPRWTAINISLVVLLGILPVAALYLTKLIVDTVTASLASPDKTPFLSQISLLIAAAAVIGILLVICRSLSDLARTAQSVEVTDSVFDILHAKSIEVDLEYYDDPESQNLLHRAQKEAPYRPTQIVNSLVQIGQNSISLVGTAWLVFMFNAWLGLVLVVVALPAAIARMRYSRTIYSFFTDQAESERKAAYYHWILTDPAHAKEIRIFNTGPFFRERFRSLRGALRQKQIGFARRKFVGDVITQGLATLVLFATLGYVAVEALQGALTVGDMVLYYVAFQSGLTFLQAILFGAATLYEDQLFLTTLYQFLSLKPGIVTPPDPLPIPESWSKGTAFQDVSYTYPGNRSPSLDRINLTVGPNEVIAIVGENGSGKTTIIKLLSLLYFPSDGTITAEGIDIRRFDPVEWRSHIGVIFQDYARYQMTAWENIWMSGVDSDPDRDQIREAARSSGADSVIDRLPDGYETMLGRWFAEGHELSQGEWQRIALARAFYRGATIIVLDEPSSSLDAEAEARLFREFREKIRGRSAILISHRYQNVRIADRIYVLHQGRIVEQGTHAELMDQRGRYARSLAEQACGATPPGTQEPAPGSRQGEGAD